MERGLSVKEVLELKHESFDFEGDWEDAFDRPERTGVWFIWGNSGNGKSTFALKLAKYLTNFGKVAYNSMEEGKSKTIKKAFQRVGMQDVQGRLILINEDIEVLIRRMRKQRSPDIVFIDSIQYTGLTAKRYFELKKALSNKLIIFISHAKGRTPATKIAERVMYDADLKIWVEGHKAFSKGRYIGKTGEYISWAVGAERYWNIDNNNKIENDD